MKLTDEAVAAAALALADEVRKWPADSSFPYDARVGVGATFQELAHVAVAAALPHLTDDGVGSGEPAVAAGEAGSNPAGNPAPSSPHPEPVAEQIATIIEEYADDLQPPTTVEWLELRDWFKDLLHEVAAKAREIGDAS
jgi:hypothetical protein